MKIGDDQFSTEKFVYYKKDGKDSVKTRTIFKELPRRKISWQW